MTIQLSENAGKIRLVVENPGTPIAAEHLPRLFDRFYRVDPSRQRKGEGSGIGLAVCDEIVQRHGGVFDIGNADGGGAIVTIRLPISGQEL